MDGGSQFACDTISHFVADIEDIGVVSSSLRNSRKRKQRPRVKSTSPATNSLLNRNVCYEEHSVGGEVSRKRIRSDKDSQSIERVRDPVNKWRIDAPANWQQIYNHVVEMRKTTIAPVDTMGCESIAEKVISPKVCIHPARFCH